MVSHWIYYMNTLQLNVFADLLSLAVKIQTPGVYPKHDLFPCELVDPITARQPDPHLCTAAVVCIFLHLECFTTLAGLAKQVLFE